MIDLRSIYLEALDRCTPESLVQSVVRRDMPRTAVAIGKCAGALLDGLASIHDIDAAFVAVPQGYRKPNVKCELAIGGHPDFTPESFAAGRKATDFVEAHHDMIFLVSGGGSACVELPLEPWFTESDLVRTNARLIASGIPIGQINIVRKHLSAIKGGRLAAKARGRTVTLIYSDVSTGALRDVASAPTMSDPSTNANAAAILERIGGCESVAAILRQEDLPETVKREVGSEAILIADNDTLTAAAADSIRTRGLHAVRWEGQIESDVSEAAATLYGRARDLREDEVLVAGGEPTVVRRGRGRGGRCSELAVRFLVAATAAHERGLSALFGSSDGADGNSGAAGVEIEAIPDRLDRAAVDAALAGSDSFPLATRLGRAIMIPPAGNNLRDLFLLARS
jgi:glycerate 2-kinase